MMKQKSYKHYQKMADTICEACTKIEDNKTYKPWANQCLGYCENTALEAVQEDLVEDKIPENKVDRENLEEEYQEALYYLRELDYDDAY